MCQGRKLLPGIYIYAARRGGVTERLIPGLPAALPERFLSEPHASVSEHGLEKPRQDGVWLWALQAREGTLPGLAAPLEVCTLPAPAPRRAMQLQG